MWRWVKLFFAHMLAQIFYAAYNKCGWRCTKLTELEHEAKLTNAALLERLSKDFRWLNWRPSKRFAWRAPRTITYERPKNEQINDFWWQNRLLHELGHAVLGHFEFKTDLERLKMEREAWEKAREFCQKYRVKFDEDLMETELDTYRDWLHQRSCCPKCGLTRFQEVGGRYFCPGCEMA